MSTTTSHYIKVGAFVALGLVVAGFLIFMIGEERHMFRPKATLHTQFRDVGGLRVGSPVRMGGIDVGSVTAIRFSEDPADPYLHVDFTVVADSMVRIRSNSVARIVSKGLLGDKALEITVGSEGPRVANGAILRGEESDEIGNAMRNATALLDRANRVMDNIVSATRPFANEQLGNDVTAMVHDLRAIVNQVAAGNGTVARLLRDDEMANRIDGTLASAQSAMRDVQDTAHQVSGMVNDARHGRGLLHALIYDEAGGRAVRSLGSAADEFAAITRDVRTGNGGLHNIIYGNDSSQAVANLNQATAAIRDIVRDVQRGRGTLGALLVDPSLYENMQTLVGQVRRNEILRAMVRYSIRADERDREQSVTARPVGGGTPSTEDRHPASGTSTDAGAN